MLPLVPGDCHRAGSDPLCALNIRATQPRCPLRNDGLTMGCDRCSEHLGLIYARSAPSLLRWGGKYQHRGPEQPSAGGAESINRHRP